MPETSIINVRPCKKHPRFRRHLCRHQLSRHAAVARHRVLRDGGLVCPQEYRLPHHYNRHPRGSRTYTVLLFAYLMKKNLHDILSYLGAFLFTSGCVGTLLKWGTLHFLHDYVLLKQVIIAIIALTCGAVLTSKYYKPLKHQ